MVGAKLKTIMGQVQHFDSAAHIIKHYNRNRNIYTIRTEADGTRVLFHKGHKTIAGIVEPKA